MTPAKLDVLVVLFAYGGNGGVATVLPTHAIWFAKAFAEMKSDSRVGRIAIKTAGDIPLSMERNRIVKEAKAGGFDVILMLDSDNVPDLYLNHRSWAKPFWKSSFDFLYEREVKGLPTVVCAPYCGPPPHPVSGGEENVYVFYSENMESGGADQHFRIAAYSRRQAAQMRGIQEIACGPTGVIMYSTSAFDLMPVNQFSKAEILDRYKAGELSRERALQLLPMQSWFFYEYTDREQSQKCSTEDVTNTREIQLAGLAKHRQPIVFCNWDAWAGHMKPKCVGMPEPIYVEQINDIYQEAMRQNLHVGDEQRTVDFTNDGVTGEESNEPVRQDPVTVEDHIPHGSQPPDPHRVPVMPRRIFGHRVNSVGHQTPLKHLEGLKSLVELLAQRHRDRALRIVEVGSWVGESAIAMQAGFGQAGGTVFCVEHFQGNDGDWLGSVVEAQGPQAIKDVFILNTKGLLDDRIKLLEGKSLEVAESLDKQDADLIFLDADHDYDSVVFDIEAWAPHVADTGYLVGHDYCREFPGVMQAVDEFMMAAGMETKLISGTSIWVCPMGEYRRACDQSRKEEPVGA